MMLNRWWFYALLFVLVGICSSLREEDDGDERMDEGEEVHHLSPRFLKVFSKGPNPDDEKYEGRDALHHFNNVRKGGTIGVKLDVKDHVERINKLWGKVKKYFSALQMKKHPSSDPESRNFGGITPGWIDPRKKWPPSIIDKLSEPDSEILDKKPEDMLDSDSEVLEKMLEDIIDYEEEIPDAKLEDMIDPDKEDDDS